MLTPKNRRANPCTNWNYSKILIDDVISLVLQVLDHYSAQGLVDVTPISLPGYQPNLPILQHMYLKSKLNNKRQNELIPYNDCLYRNIYRWVMEIDLRKDRVTVQD